MNKYIDTSFAILIAALGIWWIISGASPTPAEQITSLENSFDPAKWMDALGSDDRVVRNYARDNMADRLPDSFMEPLAIEAVNSSDDNDILAGLWIMASVDVENRGELAGQFLDSENNEIVEKALEVLALDPVPELHDQLVNLIEDETGVRHDEALKAIAAIENPDDLALFISFLGSSRINTRDIASDAIIKLAPSTPHLLSAMIGVAYDTDLSAAREALRIIGKIDNPDVLDALFEYLEIGPVGLGTEAANAIADSGLPGAGERALELFLESGGRIRNQAARVLGAIGNTDAQDYLWSTVIDPGEEFWLRFYSMEALATCGTPDHVPYVIEYIENVEPDSRLIRAGLEAIGGMGGSDVFVIYDAVIDGELDFGLNNSGGDQALISAITGLGKMKTDDSRIGAVERLTALSQSMEPGDIEFIMAIARALGKVGSRNDIDTLLDLEAVSPVAHRGCCRSNFRDL